MLEEVKEMLKERELELNKDYQNVLSTINKLDQDRSSLVNRGVQLRGALDEVKSLRARIDNKEKMKEKENEVAPTVGNQEIVGEDNVQVSPETSNQ